ncbi:hypothetical protein [Luteimonas lutimaris]|uniref:Uncharacterized protein n=1 Tax=Luteimonas lutimaris TaxID=698645 RepID=A0ABP7MZQ8_9GAMM
MGEAFEWVDFALQPPGMVVECLDAAGLDGCVPGHAAGEGAREAQGADAD